MTRRIYGPALVATGPTTVYTAPTGIRAVLQTVVVSNPTASPVTFTLSIGADAAGTRVVSAVTIAANSITTLYPRVPVEPAEIVTVSAGTNNVLVVTLAAELVAI